MANALLNIDLRLLRRWRALLAEALAGASPADLPPELATHATSPRGVALRCICRMNAINGPAKGATSAAARPPLMPNLPAPAASDSAVIAAVWSLSAAAVGGDDKAITMLDRAIAALDPTALKPTANDNPEPWWAAELMILHALRSHAWRFPSSTSEAALARYVAFHLAEIQPDHATNEPWAIHAFAASPEGQPTAETLLHAAMVQGGGTLTPAARLIVGDAFAAIDAVLLAGAGGSD